MEALSTWRRFGCFCHLLSGQEESSRRKETLRLETEAELRTRRMEVEREMDAAKLQVEKA